MNIMRLWETFQRSQWHSAYSNSGLIPIFIFSFGPQWVTSVHTLLEDPRLYTLKIRKLDHLTPSFHLSSLKAKQLRMIFFSFCQHHLKLKPHCFLLSLNTKKNLSKCSVKPCILVNRLCLILPFNYSGCLPPASVSELTNSRSSPSNCLYHFIFLPRVPISILQIKMIVN